jgi:two-component system, sensor histidine kinase
VSGLIWGSTGMLMFVPDSPTHQAVLIVALLGIATGAITVIATDVVAFYVFTSGVMAPVLLRTAWEGGAAYLFLAAIGAVVLAGILACGRNLSNALAGSLGMYYQNLELIEELKAQRAIADLARQEAENANRAKTQFFAAASHDLRQPLHAMGLFASALAQKIRDPEVTGVIASINASVQALEALFNELLDISKIDSGVIEPNLTHFPLEEVFGALRDEFAAEAQAKGLRLAVSSSDHIVLSDAVLLERITRNLLSNAIRYTSVGEVALSARPASGKVRIEVRDTGAGILEQDRERIFEEFYQVGNPGRTSKRGLGLGLSIVQRLCGLLGYTISVDSEYGKGSTFSFEVPLGATPAPRVTAPRASTTRTDLSGRLIVVIDDEAAIVDGMKVLLTGLGAEVIGSLTGDDVINAVHAKERLPDLIIADYRLDGSVTGIDVVERLREALEPEIPAILVTGSTTPETIAEAEKRHLEVLLKPVLPDRLREAIDRRLAKHGAK